MKIVLTKNVCSVIIRVKHVRLILNVHHATFQFLELFRYQNLVILHYAPAQMDIMTMVSLNYAISVILNV